MSGSLELQDIRLDSEAEPESDGGRTDEQVSSGDEKKAGLDPDSFSLVEAAQYGNLER